MHGSLSLYKLFETFQVQFGVLVTVTIIIYIISEQIDNTGMIVVML